jgi:hypothetical protein
VENARSIPKEEDMRKLLIVVLVAAAALVVCAPAMAWPVSLHWWQPDDHFTCVGKIQTVDATAGTVSVRVHLASRAVADSIGEDLLVTAAPDAVVYKAVGAALEPIALGDLVVGEKLRVEGRVDYSTGSAVYLGKRLVMRHMPIDLIRRFAFRGEVTAVDATAGTLTATLDKVTRALSPYYQGTCTFKVAPDARLWVMKNGWPAKIALTDVAAGDTVYAQGGADRSVPSLPVFTIRWMLVRHTATAALTL